MNISPPSSAAAASSSEDEAAATARHNNQEYDNTRARARRLYLIPSPSAARRVYIYTYIVRLYSEILNWQWGKVRQDER